MDIVDEKQKRVLALIKEFANGDTKTVEAVLFKPGRHSVDIHTIIKEIEEIQSKQSNTNVRAPVIVSSTEPA